MFSLKNAEKVGGFNDSSIYCVILATEDQSDLYGNVQHFLGFRVAVPKVNRRKKY